MGVRARCSDTHLQQVFWEIHQRLHLLCAACLTGSAAICISQQPFHRRWYCLHPAYCSLPPGKQERLCEDAVCGLQLRIQYHSACHTGCEAPDSRTKQISVQLNPGLSNRQKSGSQNGQQHFILGMRGIPVLEKYRYLLYFKRYDIIILHNSVYAAVAKCTCRWQCFPNCCATGKMWQQNNRWIKQMKLPAHPKWINREQ